MRPDEAAAEYGLDLVIDPADSTYDGIVLAVTHHSYRTAGAPVLRAYGRKGCVFCDPKASSAAKKAI